MYGKTWKKRNGIEQFHAYFYDYLIKRDKISLDIFWLKDKSLEEIENLPSSKEIAEEIKDYLESALDSIDELVFNLNKKYSNFNFSTEKCKSCQKRDGF